MWFVKMEIFMFSVEAMIRGYYEYMRIWESLSPTNHLLCQREIRNPHDTHAVAVKENIVGLDGITTVGHVSKKISAICSIFIRRGGTINCVVNDTCRFSADLPQGGLEIPCILNLQQKPKLKQLKLKGC